MPTGQIGLGLLAGKGLLIVPPLALRFLFGESVVCLRSGAVHDAICGGGISRSPPTGRKRKQNKLAEDRLKEMQVKLIAEVEQKVKRTKK